MSLDEWRPPERVDGDTIERASKEVLSWPDVPTRRFEDIFSVVALGLEWDLGVVVHEPRVATEARVGADGNKAGLLLLHGGDGDFKSIEPLAQLAAAKFGYKVVCGTFPGRFYFPDPSRDWPGDTIGPDGTVRTPIWQQGEHVAAHEYDVVTDTSLRERYGTRTLARARPGTAFYHRMAAWPAAFEAGMLEACRRHFPASAFSVYGQGHSTGGPFICMLSQRIPNMAGVVASEHSPFGEICAARDAWGGSLGKLAGQQTLDAGREPRRDPFEDLYIRTWRDLARYAGPEALGEQGAAALMRLPMLMEDVLAAWERERARPQFKAEYIVTHAITESLERAARVSAERLGLDADATSELVERFEGYTRAQSGPGWRPVPPFLFSIAKHSRDHSPEVYHEVILPAFAKMRPPPRTALTQFDAGGHTFWAPAPGLPVGIAPAVVRHWDTAITGGYFLSG